MSRIQIIITVLALLALSGCFRSQAGQNGNVDELELVAVLPVDVPAALEPSGMTSFNGDLYAVADKDNNTIYKVLYTGDSAQLVPALRFDAPRHYGMLDWEGITSDDSGNFFLISEKLGRLFKVSPTGQAGWATADLRNEAREIGLLSKSNAGFEGIAWLGSDHWLGAIEREPRGLVEFSINDGQLQCVPSLMDQSPYSHLLTLFRIPDYSGLDSDDGNIYALFRNAHLVVRLEKTSTGYRESEAWSFKHIETDPRWAYIEQTYAQAEGIVVNGRDVYLILDNNLGGRQSNPSDGRPMFIHARIPN